MVDDFAAVLLVEDNPDDAELITYVFKKAGIVNPLMLVDDGDKAINYMNGNLGYADRATFPLPCLILLDLKVPRRSGFEVLEAVRANRSIRHTPVVVLTSSNQELDIKRAYDLGANAYLVKPIGRDALMTMARSLDTFWIKFNRTPGS